MHVCAVSSAHELTIYTCIQKKNKKGGSDVAAVTCSEPATSSTHGPFLIAIFLANGITTHSNLSDHGVIRVHVR